MEPRGDEADEDEQCSEDAPHGRAILPPESCRAATCVRGGRCRARAIGTTARGRLRSCTGLRSACATLVFMSRRITQRELRNDSGRIMRALDKGKSFTVTRNGVPVGELVPLRPRAFVPAESVAAAFKRAPRVARRRFRKDVDAVIDQDPTPRG